MRMLAVQMASIWRLRTWNRACGKKREGAGTRFCPLQSAQRPRGWAEMKVAHPLAAAIYYYRILVHLA